MTGPDARLALADLPPWEDSDVQLVYKILCDPDLCGWTNKDEHWEGWLSRNIVAALRAEPSTVSREAVADERAFQLALDIGSGAISAPQGAVEIMQYATDGAEQLSITPPAAGMREALEKIANHPEKGADRHGGSFAVGWAFWNVQRIARAALSALPVKGPRSAHVKDICERLRASNQSDGAELIEAMADILSALTADDGAK